MKIFLDFVVAAAMDPHGGDWFVTTTNDDAPGAISNSDTSAGAAQKRRSERILLM
jgi:hypothetical protein